MSLSLRALPVAALFSLMLTPDAQAMPMGGTYTGHVDTQLPQVLGPGEMRVQQTASGTNSGPGTSLDGASVQWKETVTMKNGQGPVEGIITFITPAGTTSSTYKGMVSTDAQGRITAQGRFKSSEATGEFTGVKGDGTFSVAYTSRTDFTGEWKGNFKLPGGKTSRR